MSSRLRYGLLGVAIAMALAPAVVWAIGRQDIDDPGDYDLLVTAPTCLPAENAYHWMEQVAIEWPLDADENALLGRLGKADDCPWDDARAAELLAKLTAVRPHIDRALACSQAVSQRLGRDGVGLCRTLLEFESEVHHRAGRTDQAIHTAVDSIALGTRILRGSLHHGLEYVVGASLRGVGLQNLRRTAGRTPPDADTLDNLVRRLAAFEIDPSAWVPTALADYTGRVRELDTIAGGGPVPRELAEAVPPGAAGYWLHPNQTRRLLQVSLRRMIVAPEKPLRERFVPERVIVIPNPLDRIEARLSPNWVGRVFAEVCDPDYRGFLPEAAARDEAELSATRVLLALVAHRRRTGRLPESLEPLLPVLASIPRDPYDGVPFRYDLARRLVWVVGTHPKDEQGSPRPWDDDTAERWDSTDPAWQLPE